MTAGLQVHNSSGVLQIDETFKNLVFIQKGTLPAGSPGSPGTLTLSGRATPVLVLAGSTPAIIWSVSSSGGTYTYTVYGGTDTYYLFDVPPAPSLHGFGLQVFDASGNCAFDSNRKYMRPKGEKTTNMTSSPSPPGRSGSFLAISGAKPTGTTYGIMPVVFPWFMDADYPSSGLVTRGSYGFFWSGNDLWAQRTDVLTSSGVSTSQVHQATLGLVDISGL